MILAKRWKITSNRVYPTKEFYSRFLSSFSEGVHRAVLCSPAFDPLPEPFGNIIGFCQFLQLRDVAKIVIVTSPPGSDAGALSQETAEHLDGRGVEIVVRDDPKLNAKIYHLDFKQGWFRSFVGSADFTFAGLSTNRETIAEMEGVGPSSPSQIEIEKLVSDNKAVNFPNWNYRRLTSKAEIRA